MTASPARPDGATSPSSGSAGTASRAAGTAHGPDAVAREGEPRARRRGRLGGYLLIALARVLLILGLLAGTLHAVATGFRGAPPEMVEGEPVPLSVDAGAQWLDAEGRTAYVLVALLEDSGVEESLQAPYNAPGAEPELRRALTEEPVCHVTGPDGEAEVEVPRLWQRSEEPVVARFRSIDHGRYEASCTSGGTDLVLAVARDGTWEYDREGERSRRTSFVIMGAGGALAIASAVLGVARLNRAR